MTYVLQRNRWHRFNPDWLNRIISILFCIYLVYLEGNRRKLIHLQVRTELFQLTKWIYCKNGHFWDYSCAIKGMSSLCSGPQALVFLFFKGIIFLLVLYWIGNEICDSLRLLTCYILLSFLYHAVELGLMESMWLKLPFNKD